MMTIRAMTAADVGAVAALSDQLGYPVDAGRVAGRLDALATDPDTVVLVAEYADGGVAGWIHVAARRSIESEPYAEIAGLVVDRQRRRRGAGRALVAAVEAWARARGFATVRVRSNISRAESHPFYLGLGYRRLKTQHVYERAVASGRSVAGE
jgi:GNAT superfamily N-acetyltransferase